jgi:hypothetical protein
MCESIANTLPGFDRFGLLLVNSERNAPICRQFSETSRPVGLAQVLLSRWRQCGTGEVGPAPEQFGP